MLDTDNISDTLLTLTADIVAAHVSNNSVAVNDLPNLIQNVHTALTGIADHAAAAAAKPEPKVSIRCFDQARLYRLPGRRQEAEDAEAASDDPLST